MLIEMKFRNFLSFKEEVRFLMSSVKSFKEHSKDNIISTDKDLELLKCAAIYGSNAAGKSNFIWAINAMSKVVFNSYSDSIKKEDERKVYSLPFKLNSETENANTMFEVSFLVDSIIYRYGFEINGFEIKKEWLFKNDEREVPLFERNGQKFVINAKSFSEGKKYKKDINSNVLFISHLAQNNQKVSRIVLRWFQHLNIISGLEESQYEKYTARLLKSDSNFRIWAANILKYLEISNIEAGEKDGEIITIHNKYDENNLLVEAIPFLPKMESAGTQKLIRILGPLYDTLRSGSILFIDEFNSKLHPNLSKKLIDLFHKFNKNNAQIIFTANDTNLLNKDIFRRDQIWFAEKDQFGASSLYSLSEFSSDVVRKTSAFDKRYLDNVFGSADTLELTENIVNLLYHE